MCIYNMPTTISITADGDVSTSHYTLPATATTMHKCRTPLL